MTWYRFPIAWLGLAMLVSCDGKAPCAADEKQVGFDCVKTYVPLKTRLNSIGYLPDHVKRATLADATGAFSVRRTSDDKVVFTGTTTEPAFSAETQENLSVADFSELTQTGEFVLEVEGSRSAAFRIAPDVYTPVYRALMAGLYGLRCGQAVKLSHGKQTFEHAACHLEDASLVEYGKSSEKQNTVGGWHDAGDYGKYTNNGSFSLGMMLLAWEQFRPALERLPLDIPERGGALPDFLAECRFQLDWLLSMQLADGSVADRVTTTTFDGPVSPEASTNPRNLAPATTVATADFVAVVSRAARVMAEFDAELAASYRAAAERGWAYLLEHRANVVPAADVRSRFTGGYWGDRPDSDRDDRVWAAAELWETTGDASVLAELEDLWRAPKEVEPVDDGGAGGAGGAGEAAGAGGLDGPSAGGAAGDAGSEEAPRPPRVSVEPFWDWQNLGNLGVFTYLLSKREGRDEAFVNALTTSLAASVSTIGSNAHAHKYGRSPDTRYWWGINGIVARSVMNIKVYDALAPDPEHKNLISLQLDHLLGRNYYGRSYVTGLGYNPPLNPHHRPSQADTAREPWPGLLVGGPWSNSSLPAAAWVDESEDYNTNEVAINWNAAMIYAAASLLPGE
ncbi:MAG TPA: glycoside hydrolase family 9 protein [Polyangiaceae bacterium]|nr:glycoside hydrolase family 9 protein [Polyangiaceae bacterium]